jgi:MarR family 2-MHQ and catechol resistance regulon transcriptional repressor
MSQEHIPQPTGPDTMTGPNADVDSIVGDERITAFGLLVEAHRRLQRTFDKTLRDRHGMSGVTFEALLRLGRSDEHQMSMSELANQMVLTSGGATRLVDRLTEAGLVDRIQCATDRRVLWVRLSAAGVAALAVATETHLNDLEAHFVSEIEPHEMVVLTTVLDRLRKECTDRK